MAKRTIRSNEMNLVVSYRADLDKAMRRIAKLEAALKSLKKQPQREYEMIKVNCPKCRHDIRVFL